MPHTDQDTRPGRFPRWLIVVCLVVLVMLAGHIAWRASLNNRIAKLVEAIEARGEPLTGADLNAWRPDLPGPRNLATEWDAATALIQYADALGLDDRQLPFSGTAETPDWLLGNPVEPAWHETIDAYLKANRPAIEALIDASPVAAGRLAIDYRDGFNMTLPFNGRTRSGANLLALDATMALEAGDRDRAVDSIVAMFGAGRSLRHEALLVTHLLANAMDMLACNMIRHAVAQTQFTEAQLKRLVDAVNAVDQTDGLYRALVGERAMGIMLFREPDQLSSLMGSPGGMNWPLTAHQVLGTIKLDEALYLKVMTDNVEAAKLSPDQRAAEYARIEHEFVAAIDSFVGKRVHALTASIAPTISRASVIDLRARNDVQLVRIGLAVERYRAANGRNPATLRDLVPTYIDAVPNDLLDGKPFRYRVLADGGFVVWSPGKDGVDESGVTPDPATGKATKAGDDEAFAVQRPAAS